MKNVPQLRFKGFHNAWQQNKISKLYSVYSGNTPLRSNKCNFINGKIPWIKTTDLNNSLITSNEECITEYGANKLKLLPANTILIAMYGGFNQIGRTGMLSYSATINQALSALVPNKEINSLFLLNLLNKNIKYWRRVAASSRKDPNITKKDVENFLIKYPTLIEQQKIGTFFSKLDDLITKQTYKVELLKQLKHGYLQKLFPQVGQTTPQLRFKGFNDEWQSKKLRQLITSEWKGKAQADNLKAGTVLYLDINYLNNHNNAFYSNAVCDVNDDDIIILWDGSKAGTIYYHVSGALGSTLKAYRLNKRISNTGFVYQLLKSQQQLIFKRFRTPNIPHVVKDFTNIFKASIPDLSEQQRIATLFAKLDYLIELQNHKLELLQQLKKAYLQKMFI